MGYNYLYSVQVTCSVHVCYMYGLFECCSFTCTMYMYIVCSLWGLTMNLQLGEICFFVVAVHELCTPSSILGWEADSGDNKGRAVEEGHASDVRNHGAGHQNSD